MFTINTYSDLITHKYRFLNQFTYVEVRNSNFIVEVLAPYLGISIDMFLPNLSISFFANVNFLLIDIATFIPSFSLGPDFIRNPIYRYLINRNYNFTARSGFSMNSFIKQPSEVIPISVDFRRLLASSETIQILSVVARDDAGAIVSDVVNRYRNDSGVCKAVLQNGDVDNNYKITFLVTTSDNNVYEQDVVMKVREL